MHACLACLPACPVLAFAENAQMWGFVYEGLFLPLELRGCAGVLGFKVTLNF